MTQNPDDRDNLFSRELNHRVRNNLQVITSLLDMQKDFGQGKSADEIIDTVRNRIHSMALLHDHLANSETTDQCDIKKYIEKVCEETIAQFKDKVKIHLKMVVESKLFHQDKLILIGMIINELIQNTIRHRNTNTAQVSVRLFGSDGNSRYVLNYSDENEGTIWPVNEDSKRLGLKLIEGLARQLRANYRFIPGNKLRFEMEVETNS